MSYVPSHIGQVLMNPSALAVCTPANNTSSAVGADVQFNAASDFFGSLAASLSFSSGVITLPTGYFYYVEGSTQSYATSLNSNTYCEYKWHNGTGYIGSHGRVVQQRNPDLQLTGRDEKAFILVDATSGAVSVSLRITSVNQVWASGLNSTTAQYIYAGMGRATIWRLDP